MKGVFLLSHVYDDLLLSAATTVATLLAESFQFEEGNSCCRNVTSLGKYFGCFGINRQQLCFVSTDEFIHQGYVDIVRTQMK